MMIQMRLLGFSLVMVGCFIIAQHKGIISTMAFASKHFLFLVFGLVLMMIALAKRNGLLALISGLFTSFTLFLWGHNHITGWPSHWSIMLFLLGAGILFRCCVDKHKQTTTIGTTLLICGFCAWPKLHTIPGFSGISPFLNTYWALLIVILGVLLFRKN